MYWHMVQFKALLQDCKLENIFYTPIMITLQNISVVTEQVIWVPQLRIWGAEGTRSAEIILPVSKPSWEPLEEMSLVIDRHNFAEFYNNYTNDKYLVDLVFEKYGIVADTSSISDFS